MCNQSIRLLIVYDLKSVGAQTCDSFFNELIVKGVFNEINFENATMFKSMLYNLNMPYSYKRRFLARCTDFRFLFQ